MKSKFNTIMSLVTLTLTTFLLICIVSAWYVSNKEVSATGVIGAVDNDGIDFIGTKIYHLNKVNENIYTSSEAIIRSGDEPTITNTGIEGATILRDFDNEDNSETTTIDESITAALVVVEYEITSESSVSYVVNLATDYTKVITTEDVNALSLFQDNRLSNVVNVYSVDTDIITPNLTNGEITYYSQVAFDTTKPQDFINDSDNSMKDTSIEIGRIEYDSEEVGSSKSGYFYFVIDYNDSNINYLYDRMLEIFGNKADLTTPILFSTDLYITAI